MVNVGPLQPPGCLLCGSDHHGPCETTIAGLREGLAADAWSRIAADLAEARRNVLGGPVLWDDVDGHDLIGHIEGRPVYRTDAGLAGPGMRSEPEVELKLCSPDWDADNVVRSRHSGYGDFETRTYYWDCACGQRANVAVSGSKPRNDEKTRAVVRAAWYAHKYPGWSDTLTPRPPKRKLRLPAGVGRAVTVCTRQLGWLSLRDWIVALATLLAVFFPVIFAAVTGVLH